MKKITIPSIKAKKEKGEKIAMLTCYDASFARILDDADIDILLVGDSLGMVIQGHETTLPVTIEEVIYHTRCVVSKARKSLIVSDLPFMSYQTSPREALINAGRCLKEGGAHAVKLEGGMEQADTVKSLMNAGIPVMGHIGLKPQTIHQMGGYKIQGKTEADARQLLKDAASLEEAGCFALVLEGVVPEVAGKITELLSIPTIGIASGPHCDGQVLVLYDLLGMNPEWEPKYVKKYVEGYRIIADAVHRFSKEIREGVFPQEGDAIKKEELRVVK